MEIVNGLYALPTDELAKEKGCYFDSELPDLICNFVEALTIQSDDWNGKAGRQFKLQDWQRAAIQTGYGWKRESGELRFKQFSWWLPRRSGKSILSSALLAFTLCVAESQEAYIFASTIDQANVVWRYADNFTRSHPDLKDRFHNVKSTRLIRDKQTKSFAKVKAAQSTGSSGTSTSLALFDEIHEIKACYARDTWESVKPSLASRRNSLLVSISTAGTDRSSLAFDEYRKAKKVLDGSSNNWELFPIVYELELTEDWQDPANHVKTIPGAGVTVSKEHIQSAFEAAQKSPIEEVSFRRQWLNQWVGSPEIWIPSNILNACYWNGNESELYGSECLAYAYDWGASFDLTAATLLIKKNGLYYLLPRYFIPREIAKQREDDDSFAYISHASNHKNNLFLTDGNVVDGEAVVAQLEKDSKLFRIKEVRFDPNKMALVSNLLQKKGFDCVEVKTSQASMSPNFELFERLIREEKIRFHNSAVTEWCFGNARPKRNNDKLMIEKSGKLNKIDFIDAAAIALSSIIDGDKNKMPELPTGQQWATVW